MINLKALIVVMGLALFVFVVARPIFLQFMTKHDFALRRNTWIALTCIAFLSFNFWIFVVGAAILLFFSARKDSNPLALYATVMFALPHSISHQLPVAGINALFEINLPRIIAFSILIPLIWRQLSAPNNSKPWIHLASFLLIAYGALQVILLSPHQSVTASMRRGFLFCLDVLALYSVRVENVIHENV